MVTDVLLDTSSEAILAGLSRHQREAPATVARAVGGRVEDRPDMLLFVSGFQVPFTNGVKDARLDPSSADRRINEAVEVFRDARVPALWSVDPLSWPDDLGERLERSGWSRGTDMPWLAADLRDVEVAGPVPDGLAVRPVEDEHADAGWLEAMTAGFGLSEHEVHAIGSSARAVGFDPAGPWVRFVGSIDGRVVASSGLMTFGGVAGIFNVATAPEARRRGIGSAMTRAALRHAERLRYRVAILGTSPMGRGIYKRMGFRDLCVVHEYYWEPGPGLIVRSS